MYRGGHSLPRMVRSAAFSTKGKKSGVVLSTTYQQRAEESPEVLSYERGTPAYTQTNKHYVESYGAESLNRRQTFLAELENSGASAEVAAAANRDLARLGANLNGHGQRRQDRPLGAVKELRQDRPRDTSNTSSGSGGSPAWGDHIRGRGR